MAALLVGSTLEDVGFDHRVTSEAVRELLDFAIDWIPELRTAEMERCWAGLRPASADGMPYHGPRCRDCKTHSSRRAIIAAA